MPQPFGQSTLAVNTKGIKGRVGVRIIGDDKLLLNFSRMAKMGPEGISRVLQILADDFLNNIILFAPKDTGRYARSWRIKEQHPTRYVIGPVGMLPPRPTVTGGQSKPISAARLGYMLEFTGSSPHTIEPRVSSVLVYPQGGEIKVAKKVSHPGFKPQPHIRIALAQTRRKAKGIIYAVAADYMEVPRWKESMIRAAQQEGYSGPIPPRQTGRNRRDSNANIGRGTKANLKAKLSRPGGLTGTRIRARGKVRAIGTNENFTNRKHGQRIRGAATRFQSVGLYSQ